MGMVHLEGVGIVPVSLELILGTRGCLDCHRDPPIVRVVRCRGRVMACQVTIDWAMVGHLAMEAHTNGPP